MNKPTKTPGACFRQVLSEEKPLQIVGTINPYCALMAKAAGFRAIYLSGTAVASASYGLPDLGITNLNDVLEDIWRITSTVDTPLLVDIDTGFGNVFNIARTIKQTIKAGAAAVHIEDQMQAKRCGHRPNKAIVSKEEMMDRIKAAVDAKTDADFVVMARTDSYAIEGLQSAIERAQAYVEAGADMIFAEALLHLDEYRAFTQAVTAPVLCNITEFGVTPFFTTAELASVDVSMVLYPATAMRAMNKAALNTYNQIRKEGTQANLIDTLQTREEYYHFLNYYAYESQLDKFQEEHEAG